MTLFKTEVFLLFFIQLKVGIAAVIPSLTL